MESEKPRLLCAVDIGGTNISMAIMDEKGQIANVDTTETGQFPEPKQFVEFLGKWVNRHLPRGKSVADLRGIGVAVPSVDRSGRLVAPANLPWGEVDLHALISQHFPCPVCILNDANAVALGEWRVGGARGMDDFIVVTLGTGVGAGIVAGGQLLLGNGGFAGEFGHVTVLPDGRRCNCGRFGCLEAYVSANGIRRTALECLIRFQMDTPLSQIPADRITPEIVSQLAEEKDPVAMEVFEITGKILGAALANLAVLFDPEAIILFGGITEAGDLLFTPLRRHFSEAVLPIHRSGVRLMASQVPNGLAALHGARTFVEFCLAGKGRSPRRFGFRLNDEVHAL